MKIDPLTSIDFYKADHRRQYPKGTEFVYSNFTPRSVKYLPSIKGTDNKIVFFGLQYFIKHFLLDVFDNEFFKQPKDKVLAKYKRRLDTALGKDSVPIDHIGELHDLGYLPLSIRALPEGAVVEAKIPLFTIENTQSKFFWLTNYLETILSAYNWKPCTSATIARKYKQLATKYYNETGADLNFLPFAFHDFSYRGMGGNQDAVMSGGAHLLSFVGTDTIAAIDFLEDYYNADAEKELIGCSVPATEHSVMCMGSKDGEIETFKRLINDLYPSGIVSIVSDTWDFWKVITEYLPLLKGDILKRTGSPIGINKVVIRPDSGDPVKIICGHIWKEINSLDELTNSPDEFSGFETVKFKDKFYLIEYRTEFYDEYYYILGEEIPECEAKGAIECMWDTFGGSETSLGYKILDPHIGLIYGDSITLQRADEILSRLKDKKFAASNVVFGVGSYTYVYQTRDTLGFAMKATAGVVDGNFVEIFKDPKTDGGFKKSAKGWLAVFKDDKGEYYLKDQATIEEKINCELKPVFFDGKLLIDHSLSEIRKRLI